MCYIYLYINNVAKRLFNDVGIEEDYSIHFTFLA